MRADGEKPRVLVVWQQFFRLADGAYGSFVISGFGRLVSWIEPGLGAFP